MTPEERAEALIPNPEHIGMMAGQDRLLAEQDRQLAVAITADTIRAAVAEAKAEEREACIRDITEAADEILTPNRKELCIWFKELATEKIRTRE